MLNFRTEFFGLFAFYKRSMAQNIWGRLAPPELNRTLIESGQYCQHALAGSINCDLLLISIRQQLD